MAITQNGNATRLYRNQGSSPGLRVRLEGPAGNPNGIGASIRLRYSTGWGPRREVQAGSGYWWANGSTQVLGLPGAPTVLEVRWPNGETREIPVPPKATTLVIRQ